jgi:hypothetical protein
MKMSPDESRTGEAMGPGNISAGGFLGDETLPLPDIIARDRAEMERLGLDFEQTAGELERLAGQGAQGLGAAITVDGKWRITVEEARGLVPCPFRDGRFHKTTVSVTRIESGRELLFSDLSLHLMKAHHFLQGRGSSFRLEPTALKDLLGG